MEIGKLTNSTLKDSIISKLNIKNKNVLVGPGVGEDCSIIDFGEEVCVLTTDPITAAMNNTGTLGVHISCNDIASAGVAPLGVLVTILAPPSSKLEDIEKVMEEINLACGELNIDVLGGHTEVTDAVTRLVLSVTAIGKSKNKKFVTTGGATAGDDIIVTGFAGLEGTTIAAKDYKEYLVPRLGEAAIERAQDMLKDISVVKAGVLASEFGVSAMHDATEGGVLGAIWEVASASKCGAYIYKDRIPVKEETIAICEILKINQLKLISSGCMIITTDRGRELSELLANSGIENKIVGKITRDTMILNVDGVEEEIAPPEADEIFRIRVEK